MRTWDYWRIILGRPIMESERTVWDFFREMADYMSADPQGVQRARQEVDRLGPQAALKEVGARLGMTQADLDRGVQYLQENQLDESFLENVKKAAQWLKTKIKGFFQGELIYLVIVGLFWVTGVHLTWTHARPGIVKKLTLALWGAVAYRIYADFFREE